MLFLNKIAFKRAIVMPLSIFKNNFQELEEQSITQKKKFKVATFEMETFRHSSSAALFLTMREHRTPSQYSGKKRKKTTGDVGGWNICIPAFFAWHLHVIAFANVNSLLGTGALSH